MSVIKKTPASEHVEFHPLQRAMHEMFIYLKARPDLDDEMQQKLDSLIHAAEEPMSASEFTELEKQVREFLFKLEFYDQNNDLGRELILRRISRSMLELHLQEEDEENPYQEELINLGEQLSEVKVTSELENVRTKVLDTIMKTTMWQTEQNEQYSEAVVDLAVKLLGTLRATGDDYEEFNKNVDALVTKLQKGCTLRHLRETTEQLDLILENFSFVNDHHRKEREELIAVIKILLETLKKIDTGNAMYIGGLAEFSDKINQTKGLKDLEQIREQLLSATMNMHAQAKSASEEIQFLHSRILKSQSRVLLLEDELNKMRAKLADALIDRDFDVLTQLPNRRAFEYELAIALDNFSRHKSPHCLVMSDIDYFKEVNDGFGHQIGDKVLQNIAKILHEFVRKGDFVARFGGEEFVILLPNTTLRGSHQVIDRIRKKIEGTVFMLKNEEIRVTASFGIAELTPDFGIEEWIKRADIALYAAKKAGRNCIECAES